MKFYYFTVVTVGILILLTFAGLAPPTTSQMLTFAGVEIDPTSNNYTLSGVKSSTLWDGTSGDDLIPDGLKPLIAGFALIGIVVSFFGKSPDISYVLGALVFTISSAIVGDLLYVAGYLLSFDNSWISGITIALFVPLLWGFFITMIDYWAGRD